MTHSLRKRFWFESALAVLSVSVLMLTLISRTWIESLTGLDPDRGSGAAEWAVVATCVGITVAAVVLARSEVKRAAPTR